MKTDLQTDRRSQLVQMETQLRLAGQKLDTLWTQARTASGRTRVDLHSQIEQLRSKIRADREAQAVLKLADAAPSKN
jgi:hypothetical protein